MPLAVVLSIVGGLFLAAIMVAVWRLLGDPQPQPGVGPILLEQALDRDLRRLCRLVRERPGIDRELRRQISRFIIEQAARRAANQSTRRDSRRVRLAVRALRRAQTASELDSQWLPGYTSRHTAGQRTTP